MNIFLCRADSSFILLIPPSTTQTFPHATIGDNLPEILHSPWVDAEPGQSPDSGVLSWDIFQPRRSNVHKDAPIYMKPVNSCVRKNSSSPDVRSSRPIASPTVKVIRAGVQSRHARDMMNEVKYQTGNVQVAGTEQISHIIVKKD